MYWASKNTAWLPSFDLFNTKSIILNSDELFIFFGRKEDLLVLRNKPNADFICYLKTIGIELPQILVITSDDETKSISEEVLNEVCLINKLRDYVSKNAKNNIITNLIPFGVTKLEENLAQCISARLLSNDNITSVFNCKLTLKNLLDQFDIPAPESIICNGIEALQNEGIEFIKQYGKVVVKKPYGASGSGVIRISDVEQFKRIIGYMRRFNQHEGRIVIEKWYPAKVSYNHQYMILGGAIYQYAFSRQILHGNGTKIGGSIFDYEMKDCVIDEHSKLSRPIVEEIGKNGYQGLIGFDSIICDNEQLFPIVDINCRINLSTIFYEIFTRYFRNKYACFFYKEYILDKPISFDSLIGRMESSLYSCAKKEGIVILNFTSLNINILHDRSKTGRVFFAIISKNEQRAKEIYENAFRGGI